MRSTTTIYREKIASGETRNWRVSIFLTLADGTELDLSEADIMENSFKVMSASSSDSEFDLGSAIIGKCTFTLNNYDDRYTEYDFFNATAAVWVSLKGDTEAHRLGIYTVDEPTFAGSLVSLELLDNMWKFDRPLPTMNFPMTIQTAVQTICTACGVTLGTHTFNGYYFVIPSLPDTEMNCRELLQYMAMIGCNFCVIDSQGYLRIRWYNTLPSSSGLDGGTFDTDTTPYSDGDDADGGNFTNYNSGDDYDGGTFYDPNVVYFSRLMSRNIGTDEIEITGVKIVINEVEHTIGQAGYVLTIENPLVTESNVNSVLNMIWDVLEGFKIRTYDVTALPDITPEVGDCVGVSYKGTILYSYLTNFTFTPSLITASLGAVSPARTLVTRYSKAVQTAVEQAREQAKKQISAYDVAVQQMNELAINAMGAYQDYEDLPTGGRVYYLSNKPITKVNNVCSFVSGSTVFKLTGDGLFVSTDGGTTWQNGYNPQTGQLIVNVLYAIGIHADWVVTGLLRDSQNANYWNLDTGEFRLAATTTFGGDTIEDFVADILDDTLDQQEIFDLLTNNGQVQGITLYNGQLYINATYIQSGTMSADLVRTGALISDNYDFTQGNTFLNDGTLIDMDDGNIFTYSCSIFGENDPTGRAAYFRRIRIMPNNAYDSSEQHLYVEGTGDAYVKITPDKIVAESYSGHASVESTVIKVGNDNVLHTEMANGSFKVWSDASNNATLTHNHLFKTAYGNYYEVEWVTSDRRVKENIEDLDVALSIEFIDRTEPKKFNYLNTEGTHYGMIAQDAREVLDDLGETDAQLEHSMGIPEELSKIHDQRTIDYKEYVPHLINYVKELKAELNELKAELKALKEK